MHVLLIHQAYTSLDEAGGTRHAELAQYLADHGHQVTVIASPVSYLTGKIKPSLPYQKEGTDKPGVTVLLARTYSKYNRSFFHRVVSFFSFTWSSFFVGMKVRKPDVVWGTSPPIFQGFSAWLIARFKHARFLFEVRDLWPEFAIALGVIRNPILKSLSLGLEKFLYRKADRVVVNSPGFIDHVKKLGARKVELIPNGADPAMFISKDNGKGFRKDHHLEYHFVVTYAGAHGLSNDLEIVLLAANTLKDNTTIKFLLAGDGKDKKSLMDRAVNLGLSNVLFLDPLPKNQIADLLAASDACLAILKPIELYKTTYPNKVFDYMAAGKPVICAIDGEIRKVVESAGAGVFVQPGDPDKLAKAVITLFKDPKSGERMGKAGKEYLARNFLRERFSREFEQLIAGMEKKHD